MRPSRPELVSLSREGIGGHKHAPLSLQRHQVPTSFPAHPELRTLPLESLDAGKTRKRPLTMTVFEIAPLVTLWPKGVVPNLDSTMVDVAAPNAGEAGLLDVISGECRHGL